MDTTAAVKSILTLAADNTDSHQLKAYVTHKTGPGFTPHEDEQRILTRADNIAILGKFSRLEGISITPGRITVKHEGENGQKIITAQLNPGTFEKMQKIAKTQQKGE